MTDRIYFKARGKVQGIGYRWFVMDSARKHNLRGWVRNVEDGSVEGKAAGEKDNLNQFLKEIKTGHSAAKVNQLSVHTIDEELPEDFHIEP